MVITASKIERETTKKQKTAKDATTPRDNASTAQTPQTTQDVTMSMTRAIVQTTESPDATTSRVSAITAQTTQGATMSVARSAPQTTEEGLDTTVATDGQGKHYRLQRL